MSEHSKTPGSPPPKPPNPPTSPVARAAGGRSAAARLETAGSQLFAPWRLSYLEMLKHDERAAAAEDDHHDDEAGDDQSGGGGGASRPRASTGCFLRDDWLDPERDAENLVVVRTGREELSARNGGRGGLILLNRYPYTNGHLLVALGCSRMRLLDYAPEQRAELWSLVDLATDLVERVLGCQGVNIGINQGAAAGAGVPEHLHVHVVPRWSGDVNFMDVVGRVRIIPSALEEMHARMVAAWERIRSSG